MPQVDLETLVSVCAGGSFDGKVACETVAAADRMAEQPDQEEVPSDFPPESFWLSKDAELDWFDRNAFYERKDSTKASSNSTNLNPNLNPNSNSSSQRFSLKSKASIIGLPKPQKPSYVDAKNRRNCRAGNTRLFPKRSGSVGKSDAPMVEPSSPKVSCMGRVRSKKDRNRRLRNRQRSSEPAESKSKPAGRKRTGLFSSFRAIFRSGCREIPEVEVDVPLPTQTPPRKSAKIIVHDIRDRLPASEIDAPARKSVGESEAPGLGGMKRFASGRRSETWGTGDAVETWQNLSG